MAVLVEACVDAIDAAIEAQAGGAGRVELCGELLQGGVTPSAGLTAAVRERLAIPVFVLIRPRTGDFLYTTDECDVMRRDIIIAKQVGADGVVFGALNVAGDVDAYTMRELMSAARPMAVTFHRAFDFSRDQDSALGALMELGVDRVLTSGGAASALEGAHVLRQLAQRAGPALRILAGGSITPSNVAEVVRLSGALEVHTRAAVRRESTMAYRRPGVTLARMQALSEYDRNAASAGEVARVVAALSS